MLDLGQLKEIFLTCEFSSLKSAKDLKELSGFAIVNIGYPHSDLFILHKNPYSTSL